MKANIFARKCKSNDFQKTIFLCENEGELEKLPSGQSVLSNSGETISKNKYTDQQISNIDVNVLAIGYAHMPFVLE